MVDIEIEISTYNRSHILKKWLENNYDCLERLGISLAIYDSSMNDETQELLVEWNKSLQSKKIKYVRVDSETRVDEKVLLSMIESEHNYVWPLGDSRNINFKDIEEKVISFLETDYDLACIWSETCLNNDGKTYDNALDFFNDCFWHATWLGGLILRRELLDELQNSEKLKKYLEKYNRNDGFSYLGILYEIMAGKKIMASFSVIGIEEISKNKKPGWLKRYLQVWCDNLCFLMDMLPEYYTPIKRKVLKEVWTKLELDGAYWCYQARISGGLNKEIFQYYDEKGLIDRVSDNKIRIRWFATLNKIFLLIYYMELKAKKKILRIVKK